MDEIAALGFGHADLVLAVPRCWVDVDTLDDLDAAAAAFRARHGYRLRIATKYHRLVRDFLRAGGGADYALVDSQGATEGTVKNEAAEAIADITSTGETLRANHLKVLADGLILQSQATLWQSRVAPCAPEDAAVRLAQAMYRSEVLEGFDIRQSVLEPVTVGKLEVQQVGEYRGADLKGLILRVRNSGRDAQVLNENMLAARGAVAFMTPVSELAAGQETAVYLIQANGGR